MRCLLSSVYHFQAMSKNVGIFSFGYWGFGGDVQGLKQRFLRFNENTRGRGLLWIDLRISRSVRSVGFTGDAPRDAFGKRNYMWIKAFGNQRVRKRKDGVEIADYEAGFAELLKAIDQARRSETRLDFVLCLPARLLLPSQQRDAVAKEASCSRTYCWG